MSEIQELPLDPQPTPASNGHALAEKPIAAPGPTEFDWLEDETVIVPSQPATAIYFNAAGDVVIRQEGDYPGEDAFIRIRPENLAPLVKRLQEIERTGE